MKKGSRSGYDAETGEERASSESALGEPYEQPSLYRIRRSQKSHQFLRQDRCGRDRGRRQRAGWIYDTLKPYGEQLEMAHPAKMKAISAGKKKSDTIDARTIADLVRCNFLPAC